MLFLVDSVESLPDEVVMQAIEEHADMEAKPLTIHFEILSALFPAKLTPIHL